MNPARPLCVNLLTRLAPFGLATLGVIALSACGYRAVDGAATASVFTWVDIDSDGILDAQEQPLPWVTTTIAYPDFLTGSDGWGHPWLFKPGCARSCWRGEFVWVKAPPGYVATTPLRFALAGDHRSYYIGFRPVGESPVVTFSGEPSWYLAFVHRGAKVLDFHYSGDGQLSLTLDRDPYPSDYYSDEYERERFFDVYFIDIVLDLVDRHDVSLDKVNLIMLPSGETITCTVAALREWDGRIPGSEIVVEHCEHK